MTCKTAPSINAAMPKINLASLPTSRPPRGEVIPRLMLRFQRAIVGRASGRQAARSNWHRPSLRPVRLPGPPRLCPHRPACSYGTSGRPVVAAYDLEARTSDGRNGVVARRDPPLDSRVPLRTLGVLLRRGRFGRRWHSRSSLLLVVEPQSVCRIRRLASLGQGDEADLRPRVEATGVTRDRRVWPNYIPSAPWEAGASSAALGLDDTPTGHSYGPRQD